MRSASIDKLAAVPRPWQQFLLASPFVLAHLAAFGALWTGVRPIDWAVCFGLYFVRMFGVTGGYHRYFSHKTYKTSRVFQFLLAILAMSSAQKGILWWAAHHRVHHKKSDTPDDVHSPRQHGVFYAHVGWLFAGTEETDERMVRDLGRFPELVFLNKHWWIPPTALGFLVFGVLGWSGLFVGFFLSTILLWHGTFTINSLSHVFGRQAYDTGDDSRNNWLLACITLGEGWHNNHHYYQASARNGFRWWQVDITYMTLRVFAALGLVWDLRLPPQAIIDRGRAWVDSPRTIDHTQPFAPSLASASPVAALSAVAPGELSVGADSAA